MEDSHKDKSRAKRKSKVQYRDNESEDKEEVLTITRLEE